MICPYRKQTKTVDGTTSEYYMDCYGKECPYYYKGINTFDSTEYEECKRVETAFWEATHPIIPRSNLSEFPTGSKRGEE